VNVTVPPNTTATLVLPAASEKTATEGGAPLGQAQGVRRVGAPAGQVLLELVPGTYEFKSSLTTIGKL
jgi:alpha-L-rhamnosidase